MDEYINEICKILDISIPKIISTSNSLGTDTTLAIVIPNKNTIYIKKSSQYTLDTFFSVAHELRHLWQYKTNKDFYFKNYKNSDTLSVDEYNCQIAELDAHAFAYIVSVDFFGVKPLFNSFSQETKNMIMEQVSNIAKSFA